MGNTQPSIRVEAKVVGKRRPAATPWHIPLAELFPNTSAVETPLQLRTLIEYVVRAEVRAFQQRQEGRRLLHVLSPRQIDDAASQGKITLGGVEQTQIKENVDEDAAVRIALQGFADGLYLVFLDAQPQRDLDAPIQLQPTSTLLFVRLVGG